MTAAVPPREAGTKYRDEHVLAWRHALESINIRLSVWRIHRRIGMSGGLFVDAVARETGRELTPDDIARAQRAHRESYEDPADLLRHLDEIGVRSAV